MAQLQFKGKQLVQNHHLAVEYHELVPRKDKSLTNKVSLNDNLIIHGDNLKALKALLPTYAGKIKCIYIDPPYNTGNEKWVYNDNVNHPMFKEWLGKVVDKDDLTRHDKWLCMMMPRLKLLRELLADDGVIFVSINETEYHLLRMVMDEVFGVDNYSATVAWKARVKPVNIGESKYKPQREIEFVLIFEKTLGKSQFYPIITGSQRSYPYKINGRRYRLATILKSNRGANYRPTMGFGLNNFTPPQGQRWQASKSKIRKLFDEGYVEFKKGTPFRRYFEDEEEPEHNPFYCFMQSEWSGTSEQGKNELNEILGSFHGFDTVKPKKLIETLLQTVLDKDGNSVVLDSFAGSGTTAQAVIDLNKKDGGNRKFILVELEDYADKITAERVRRVIKGVPKAKDEKLRQGLGGTFSYFELGEPIELYSILSGHRLPSYLEFARYIFYTATGEEFDEKKANPKTGFIGESKDYEIYLVYQPDLKYLKNTALTLDMAGKLPKYKGKKRLVFAPTKYLDQDQLDEYHLAFAQLPFEIYKLAR